MNKSIRILHYEDQKDDSTLIDYHLVYVAKAFELTIESKICNTVQETIDEIDVNHNIDLIILDLLDHQNKPTGLNILQRLANKNLRIPVIIYTSADRKAIPTTSEFDQYKFIIADIQKNIDYKQIKDAFRQFLENYDFAPLCYSYDADDSILNAEIHSISGRELNNILLRIKSKKTIKDKIVLERISGGFSGAVLVRIKPTNLVLKISRDKLALRKEYENIDSYNKLPFQFRVPYDSSFTFEDLSTSNVSAIVIEFAKNYQTLSDWLLKKRRSEKAIRGVLLKLFSQTGLGTNFYNVNKFDDRAKFDYIFSQIEAKRFSYIVKAIDELKPIIERYPKVPFDEQTIRSLAMHRSYKSLDKTLFVKDSYKKNLLLCHGDLHSRNIMISEDNESTILIDTGGFGADYWCSDPARLLVSLFINGFDFKTYSYFSTKEQLKHLKTGKKIISGDPVKVERSNNALGVAINVINANVGATFSNFYSRWEFQLGLSREFLLLSYKRDTLPPSKRVLCLFSAYEAIIQANALAEKELKKL